MTPWTPPFPLHSLYCLLLRWRLLCVNGSAHDGVIVIYPARILGFVTVKNVTEAVIHCAEKPFNWSDVEDKFIVRTKLGSTVEVSIVSVPISLLVHHLCALPDYGSDSLSYIIVLPKCNWSRYFGDKI